MKFGDSHNFDKRFNTQPPEGGWKYLLTADLSTVLVSTHSRPKAAGCGRYVRLSAGRCFNTQPPEGGWEA